ncbi:MAG TPA: ribosome maturation factor RimP [Myxococcota bacterium]|nr:ribosome maturation factor RimP [Myxococcota bacterium]
MSELTHYQGEIFELLQPTIARTGFELVAVEMTSVGGRRTLRVSVDKSVGMTGNALASLSRQLSPLLDAEDVISGGYDLEVSSPGIERPVQRRDDFARFAGYSIKITLDAGQGRRRFKGVLRGIEEDLVAVDVDGVVHELSFERIERANLVLDLDEYQRLGEALPPRVD